MKKILISLLVVLLIACNGVMAEETEATSDEQESISEVIEINTEESGEEGGKVVVISEGNNEFQNPSEEQQKNLSETPENTTEIAEDMPEIPEVTEETPELADFTTSVIYNEDHTVATVNVEYHGECTELTLANEKEIIPFVEAGLYQVNMEQGGWSNKIAFDVLSNGMICLEINIWDNDTLIGTKLVKSSVIGLNNDALIFEPEQATYEITSSDVESSDSRNMTLSYETNVSFTWSIPTELPMADVEDDLTVTVNNSNLATETALRIRVTSDNNYNLIDSESGESLSYMMKDLSDNLIHNNDVILDHIYNQKTTSNSLHFKLTQMPVMSGKYEDTLCFTASVERMFKDIYSGQNVTISNLSATHSLINTKIYGVSKQEGTPTPDNPVEIQSVVNPSVEATGKNLWDEQYILTGYIKDDGSVATGYGTIASKNFITVEPNCTYHFHVPYSINDYGIRVAQYDKNKNFLSVKEYYSSNITTSNETRFIKFNVNNIYNPTAYKNDIAIIKGTSGTYEPYAGEPHTATLSYTLNAIPVSSGGNITIDGQQYIADYVDIENKKLVRKIGKEVLDGSDDERWNKNNTDADNYLYYCAINNLKTSNILCDKLSVKTVDEINGANTKDCLGTVGSPQFKVVYINVGYYMEKNNWDSLLSFLRSNPITIYYALVTPTETDLTDAEVQAFKDLYTYSPTTVVSASSGQLIPYVEFGLS